MKKLLLICFLASFIAACNNDDEDSTEPTDSNFDISEKTRPLLLMGYGPGDPGTVTYEVFRLKSEHEYGKDLNHLSLVVVPGNPLYSRAADSIRTNFMSLTPPFFVLDWEDVSPPEIFDAIEDNLTKSPLLSVAHKTSSNDTAWIIDSKVKFYKDTASPSLRIQTYLLGKIKAERNSNVDLRAPDVQDVVVTGDSASSWESDIQSMDTSEVIVSQGDSYYHQNILLKGFDESSAWGTTLGSYWPFGGEFYEGDVIGTEDTPIRHHFLKPEEGDFPFDFEPRFLTVVWIKNPVSNQWEYVNSYSAN